MNERRNGNVGWSGFGLPGRYWLFSAAMMTAAAAFAYAQMPSAPPAAAQGRRNGTVGSQGPLPVHTAFTAAQITAGQGAFQQNCAFCHGKEAGGGESGPDLTRSKLVAGDKDGEAIGLVVRNGRMEKGMPRFSLGDAEVMNLVAFIHSQQDKAMSETGTRKGVDVEDLQTGDLEAGKKYFEGAGGCVKCHSVTGDLKGLATKYEGLKLEQQMLYPKNVVSKVTVTAAGKTYNGKLTYQDEFVVGMTDGDGVYHSWPVNTVKFKVDSPVDAHVELFDKYTDDDIHNLMKYMQSLK